MSIAPGYFITPADPDDPRLWLIFHAEEEGAMGIDITTEHPDIGYGGFKNVLDFENTAAPEMQTVLLGGPMRPSDALLMLHERAAAADDAHVLTEDLAFSSYTYVLLPGKPPVLTTPDNKPSRVQIKRPSRLLIVLGLRIFAADELRKNMESGLWITRPASPAIVFDAPLEERKSRALRMVN